MKHFDITINKKDKFAHTRKQKCKKNLRLIKKYPRRRMHPAATSLQASMDIKNGEEERRKNEKKKKEKGKPREREREWRKERSNWKETKDEREWHAHLSHLIS